MSMDDERNITDAELKELKRIYRDMKNLFKCQTVDGMRYCGECVWYYEHECALVRLGDLIELTETIQAHMKEEADA